MATDRKTGLGSSLLLQRTAKPAEPVQPKDVPVQETPSPELSPTPATEPQPESTVETPVDVPPFASNPSSTPKKRRTEKLTLRDRCTIYLERGVNEQLHMTSRIEGRERSEIVSEILQKHLPKYRIEREK